MRLLPPDAVAHMMYHPDEAIPQRSSLLRPVRLSRIAGERSFSAWREYCKTQIPEQAFASAGDCYWYFRHMKEMCECGTPDQASDANALLQRLSETFQTGLQMNTLVAYARRSGRLSFSHREHDGEAAHQKEAVCPASTITVHGLAQHQLDELIQSARGVSFLQALFQTDDSAEMIAETLHFIKPKGDQGIILLAFDNRNRIAKTKTLAMRSQYDPFLPGGGGSELYINATIPTDSTEARYIFGIHKEDVR